VDVTVLGVPDSAGAYCVGVEQAPAALRQAGLIEALDASGRRVHDAGDLTMRRWRPDPANRYAQNLGDEVEALTELSDAAAPLLAAGRRLLVLGGSCMVAVGMCAALSSAEQQPRIVYIDRHLDLNTPASTTEGSFSWMGMAHALSVDGSVRELAEATGRTPLLDPSDLVYLGVDENRATDWERSQLRSLGISTVSQDELCADPRRAARTARDSLASGPFVIHLDVDVLDFLDAPIAENVNGRNSGPSIAQLEPALAELLRHPDCWGLSIGQLDPAHAASDPTAVPRLVGAIVSAITPSDERRS
jgi:arginase